MRAGACKLLGFLGMREGQGMRVRSARHSHIPYLLGWKVQGWGWDEFLEKAKSEWHTLPSGSRENMLESSFSIVSCSGSLPLSPELLPKADARGSCGTHLGRNYPNPYIQGPWLPGTEKVPQWTESDQAGIPLCFVQETGGQHL